MAVAFDVLAEPNRRRILELVREAERPVGDLVDELDLSQPAVSKHLRVLREAGLVEVRTDAHSGTRFHLRTGPVSRPFIPEFRRAPCIPPLRSERISRTTGAACCHAARVQADRRIGSAFRARMRCSP